MTQTPSYDIPVRTEVILQQGKNESSVKIKTVTWTKDKLDMTDKKCDKNTAEVDPIDEKIAIAPLTSTENKLGSVAPTITSQDNFLMAMKRRLSSRHGMLFTY